VSTKKQGVPSISLAPYERPCSPMYLLTYIFIVNKNSYETITKVLSDWGYVQAGALYGE
jgi:hypothetical protein